MYSAEALEIEKTKMVYLKAVSARQELIYKKMERENGVESAEESLIEQDMIAEEVEAEMKGAKKLSAKDQMKLELKKSQCGTNKLRVLIMVEDKKEEVQRISDHIALQETIIEETKGLLDGLGGTEGFVEV